MFSRPVASRALPACVVACLTAACEGPSGPTAPSGEPPSAGLRYDTPMRPTPGRADPGYLRSRSAGSLALSRDDRTLFVADEDGGELLVVDVPDVRVRARVRVGEGPRAVVLDDDGLAWVTCRDDRSMSVVDGEAGRVVARLLVGPEPGGLAVSADGRTVMAVSRLGRSLVLFDAATRAQVGAVALDDDPVHVVSPVPGRAFVLHGRDGAASVVDLAAKAVVARVSLTEPPGPGQEAREAGQPAVPAYVARQNVLWVPHQLAKAEATPTDVPDAYLGRALKLPVVAYGLARLDLSTEQLLPSAGTCFGCGNVNETGGAEAAAKVTGAVQRARFHPMAGPTAAVTDGEGRFVFVANRLSGNLSTFPTSHQPEDVFPVKLGAGPSGLALASTDDVLYAYASFEHRLTVVGPRLGLYEGEDPANPNTNAGENLLRVLRHETIAPDTLPPAVANGRRLFHAAEDPRMTDPTDGGLACASCHPDGRHDGRVWQFSEGPRDTPLLAGRRLVATEPYHWDGLLPTVPSFFGFIRERLGGKPDFKVDRHGTELAESDLRDIFRWLEWLPPPDNALLDEPSEAAERGRAVFERKAGCASCHPAPLYTDNGFHDVGTGVVANPYPGGHPDRFPTGINTPTLLGVFASAPYLHDGSVATLRDRVTRNPGDLHGTTSHLTPQEVDDLVAFLERL
jgi:DNA-binding beta-propeller fold protein YncE